MTAVYAIIGAVLGLVAGSMGRSPALGLAAGLAIGLLFDRIRVLRNELELHRDLLDALRTQRATPSTETTELAAGESLAREDAESPPFEPPTVTDALAATRDAPRATDAWPEPQQTAKPFEPIGRLFAVARDWLTTGNVPAKVGVLVSFFGVSFLLKYAIDRNLLNLPIEVRLLAVALAGLVMAGVGWRLRQRRRNYALVLQGGGLGILFLTVYAALRIWQLIPATLAFALLAALAAATALLAVAQNARTLAMFGVAGGFLAPLLASTGQGSHVVLFSYYLVLNLGILAIAWKRAWRGLNLLGFAFTFIIALFWGYRFFRPELFASTEPFLVAHFLLYQAVAILYALRRPPDRPDLVDGTLVFGTPVMVFGLQSAMLYDTEYGLAISAAVLAIFYAACAIVLRRRDQRLPILLGEAYLALAVAFGTVAIPLAFDARWTTAAWALEGAALAWVGVRQTRLLATAAGVALVFLAGLFFLDGGWQRDAGLPVLNGNVMGGLMVSLAALFAARRLPGFDAPEQLAPAFRGVALVLLTWGVAWWVGTGWMEITDRAPQRWQMPDVLLFNALSALTAIGIARWRNWPGLRAAAAAHLPLLLAPALMALAERGHFLYGAGAFAWPVAWAAQAWLLRDMDRHGGRLAAAWHVASLFALTWLAAIEAAWRIDRFAGVDWALAAAVSMAGLASLLVTAGRRRPGWPVPAHPGAYRHAAVALALVQAGAMAVLGVARPGDPAPWTYLPLLNPFGLGMLFALLTGTVVLRTAGRRLAADAPLDPLRAALAACALVMTSTAIVRAVHFYTGVAWDFDALFASDTVQAALAIWWGLLGFTGMVLGARRAQRVTWFAGAGLMALVLAKLFLVDLGNSGTIERVVSFIGTGVLLLIVGYFAPVPPRDGADEHATR